MLTKEQIRAAEAAAEENDLPVLTDSARCDAATDTGPQPALASSCPDVAPARTAQRAIPTNHDSIATAMLRRMLDDNLRLAGRMLDIGDAGSAKRLLQSAISQCDQIASYNQPAGAHRDAATTTVEI